MNGTKSKEKGHIVFCALETYSLIGGLQNFNRRVIANLAARAETRKEADVQVLLLRDQTATPPVLAHASIHSFAHRLEYFRAFLQCVPHCCMLILGHINLLPFALVLRCLRPSTPILLFVHGDEVWNHVKYRRKGAHESWLLRLVTRIASVSEFTAEVMAREFNVHKSKFILLPNAVDPRPVQAYAPERSIEKSPLNILTVTRLEAGDGEKHVDKVLRAVAILRKTVPGLNYEIIGAGSLQVELENLVHELDLEQNVAFLGKVDQMTLHRAYARAAVFILPSSKEGFGIVYLEAWLHSTPVICSSEGASKEIVSNGIDGFIVDPNDTSKMADLLLSLLMNPEKARMMGESGRRKVEERYLNGHFRHNLDLIVDNTLRYNNNKTPLGAMADSDSAHS